MTINFGKLTDQQVAFLESVKWHLEEHPADAGRDRSKGFRTLRVVYPTMKQVGRWFSDNWNPVPWEFIKPHCDIGSLASFRT